MNSLKYLTLFTALIILIPAKAQDSLKKLSAQQVMEIVKQFHGKRQKQQL